MVERLRLVNVSEKVLLVFRFGVLLSLSGENRRICYITFGHIETLKPGLHFGKFRDGSVPVEDQLGFPVSGVAILHSKRFVDDAVI